MDVFGPAFHKTFLTYKRAESHEYAAVVTEYEIRTLMQRI